MKNIDNIEEIKTLQKYQSHWVAFDNDKNILLSSKSYLELLKLINKENQKDVEITYIHPSNLYIAP